MAKKGIDTAAQNKKKANAGTATQTAKAGSARKPGRNEKTWHICDFQDLFELSDDVRKSRTGPLRYVKSICCLSPFAPDAETRHFERMRLLKSRPERHLLRSLLQDLTDWTAIKSFKLRGYLVTSESRPATPDYLSAQLNLTLEDIKRGLSILEQLGFLERIPMNGQQESEPVKRKKANSKKSKTAPSKGTRKTVRKSRKAAKDTVGRHKERLPESNGPKRPALKKTKTKYKTKTKAKYKTKANETLTGFGKAKTEEKKERGFKAPRNNKPGRTEQTDQKKQAEQRATEEQREKRAAEEPEKPEKPENPTDPEAGAAELHILPKPPHSVIRRAGPQSIGAVIGSRFPEHWRDPDAEAFGWEIVKAIGLPDDRNNTIVRSEWGAFASWWCRVKKASPSMSLDELRSIAVGKADFVRRKARKAKNHSAVWTHIMAGELSHRGVDITPPSRASPEYREAL